MYPLGRARKVVATLERPGVKFRRQNGETKQAKDKLKGRGEGRNGALFKGEGLSDQV